MFYAQFSCISIRRWIPMTSLARVLLLSFLFLSLAHVNSYAKDKLVKEPVIRDVKAIKSSGKLIVAVPDQRMPPFFLKDSDGKLKGLDIELATAIAEELGVSVEFNQEGKNFNGAVSLVEKGKADIAVAKISQTQERSQRILFSDPYIILPHALLVNRLRFAQIAENKSLTEVMQNYKETIGVIANSSFVSFAKKNFPKAKIVEMETWEQVVDAVSSGKITMAYRDAFEVKRIFKIRPDLGLTVRVVIIDDIKDSIVIPIHPNNHLLLSYINVFLEQRNIKYTPDKILKKYEKLLN